MSAAAPGPRIELELHAALAAVLSAGGPGIVTELAERANGVMAGYGIPGRAQAVIRPTSGVRAACVLVDGRISPYPPSFLRRLWLSIAPPPLRAVAFDREVPDRYRDAWLLACAEDPKPETSRVLEELMRRLVEDVLGLRPSLLVTPAGIGVADERDPLLVIGRALVDRGVRLPDLTELERLLGEHRSLGRSPADSLEDVYAGLRGRALEVHVHADVLADLAGEAAIDRIAADHPGLDGDLLAAMTAIREHHLVELGVRLPVVLVRSAAVHADEIRVKLNDRLGPPIPIPRPGELGVSAPMARLAGYGISARPLVDAVTGHEFAAVPEQDADAPEVRDLLPARPAAYIAAAFGRAVSPLAHRLLSVVEVERDLAALEHAFPSLVHGVLSRFSLTTVTHVFREIVRDRVSIRDPWRVLNAMRCFVTMEEVGDSDLPSEALGEGADGGLSGSQPGIDPRLVAFVRREIGDRVCHDSGALDQVGRVTMPVYVTESAFEARLASIAARPDNDAELMSIRDDVWRALGEFPPPEPVFVTGAPVRRALRWALSYELPGARVIARSELPPEVDLERLGVVTCLA